MNTAHYTIIIIAIITIINFNDDSKTKSKSWLWPRMITRMTMNMDSSSSFSLSSINHQSINQSSISQSAIINHHWSSIILNHQSIINQSINHQSSIVIIIQSVCRCHWSAAAQTASDPECHCSLPEPRSTSIWRQFGLYKWHYYYYYHHHHHHDWPAAACWQNFSDTEPTSSTVVSSSEVRSGVEPLLLATWGILRMVFCLHTDRQQTKRQSTNSLQLHTHNISIHS